MRKSYIDYAMSVIVSRALPDIRDGLKPVQRRVLYDMHELGLRYDRPYRKSARIVGDTMGKYHPHGDSSIYDALVVMAQDFKKGLTLVDGHGNFGTIEGDEQAAMRYTEARLQKVAQEHFLADLDKDVVDFKPNFDETEREPEVLPVRIPHFLVNGSEGIAVGMATSTPPHNLKEVLDAEIALLEDATLTSKKLMKYIKGPDFPSGGIVINKDELLQIYETGEGKIRIRGRVTTEKLKNGHINLIVTEVPYTMIGAGIGKFCADVAALQENRITTDVVDISNQTSKEGVRIVIELKKDADVDNFTNLLYKKTKLEDTFGVNMLAIRDGRPETLGLKEILQAHVDFLMEVARRKYTTLLEKEREKKEVQEGLIKACNVIDLIIEILRGSQTRQMAKDCLVKGTTAGISFKSRESKVMAAQLLFTEKQADAILDMRLYRLIGLEIEALVKQHEETCANIYRYEDILEERTSMIRVISDELAGIRKEYGKKRLTEIGNFEEAVFEEKKIEEADVAFLMDRFGYAKTIDVATYEKNAEAVASDFKYAFVCKNTGKICVFTDTGQLHTFKCADLPATKLRDKGVPVDNVSNYDSSAEQIVAVLPQSALNLYRLVFVTKFAMLKTVDGGELEVSRHTVAATQLAQGDALVGVYALTTQKTIVLESNDSFYLRFELSEIPEKKKNAIGVRGMKLSSADYVRAVYLLDDADTTVVETSRGTSLALNSLKITGRDLKGSKK
ncbi:MAG: DNA topoisomerase 4 subunit A [Lachnospiraceae bacterium]|nr:DNA topoisomerase 4 subunit A [Lachnospiraceae bacterium]